MERTTISLPQHILDRLCRIAADQGRSMADIVREAVEEKVEDYRPRPRSLGMGASGHRDTARRSGQERPERRPCR